MVWYGEPVSAPVMMGVRKIYEESEQIKIGCQPNKPYHSDHQPSLQWYIQGTQVSEEWVVPYGDPGGIMGVSLHLPAHKVFPSGNGGGKSVVVVVECRLTLGPHQLSTNTTFRVRGRRLSYHTTSYHASESQRAEASSGPLTPPSGAATLHLTTALITTTSRLFKNYDQPLHSLQDRDGN
ncbi:hypothetical protein Pmani_033588 [Petrolisthes manimaculis]|uniref:Uncharacterized protein n=1 Tax=Petrolisthes manimaculis TaxID=1843537 RepID=A0AAE1NQM4_9EUCA|nr:hypothetical protein Pmani_033588 [Petrolisthes manimaculis]